MFNNKERKQKKNETIQKKKRKMVIVGMLSVFFIAFFFLGTDVFASGLLPEISGNSNDAIFERYPLMRYQLDLHLTGEGSGWFGGQTIGERIGNAILVMMNGLANIIWISTLLLSSLTGWLVSEAFTLDLIGELSVGLASNMEALWTAFLDAFGGFIFTIVTVYVVYVGAFKREATKAWSAVINFAGIMIIGIVFFGNATFYINMINDFSRDMSTTALEAGTSFLVPESDAQGVELIREMLWDLQITQPWLIMNFGRTNIGYARYSRILAQPWGSEARIELVEHEVMELGNEAMGVSNIFPRIGYTLLFAPFNLTVTIFSLFLVGMILFAQIMFIVFASFLGISLIVSMMPMFSNLRKRAVMEIFNTMTMRLGVTILAVVTFSISTMLFTMSSGTPFAFVMFLQIVCFVGIFFNVGKILNKFNLQTDEQRSLSKRIMTDPAKKFLTMKWAGHGIRRRREQRNFNNNNRRRQSDESESNLRNSLTKKSETNRDKQSKSHGLGRRVGNVLVTGKRVKNTASNVKRSAQNLPTNLAYEMHRAKQGVKRRATDVVDGLTNAVVGVDDKQAKKKADNEQRIANRRRELNRAKNLRGNGLPLNAGPIINNSQSRAKFKGNIGNNVNHQTVPPKIVRRMKKGRIATNRYKEVKEIDAVIGHTKPDFTVTKEYLKNKKAKPSNRTTNQKARIDNQSKETTSKNKMGRTFENKKTGHGTQNLNKKNARTAKLNEGASKRGVNNERRNVRRSK